jgi:hypothetical protein
VKIRLSARPNVRHSGMSARFTRGRGDQRTGGGITPACRRESADDGQLFALPVVLRKTAPRVQHQVRATDKPLPVHYVVEAALADETVGFEFVGCAGNVAGIIASSAETLSDPVA